MLRLPRPSWWSQILCPHPALAAHAPVPPPLSQWCTTAPSAATAHVHLPSQLSRKTDSLRAFPSPLQPTPQWYLPRPLNLPPLPNSTPRTCLAQHPQPLWSQPRPRPFRLCRTESQPPPPSFSRVRLLPLPKSFTPHFPKDWDSSTNKEMQLVKGCN